MVREPPVNVPIVRVVNQPIVQRANHPTPDGTPCLDPHFFHAQPALLQDLEVGVACQAQDEAYG